MAPDRTQRDAQPQVLAGRYELGEVLGAGGTGTVRRARDRVLDRTVAVKLLRSGAYDETAQARLRAEARLAGGLQHPGIAQVFDLGEQPADDGGPPAPFLVMELVEGRSLWHLLKARHRLPPGQVADIVAQVATALQAAHAAGVVHRDLKPGNMLLTPEGRVVLVDFGIARSGGTDPLTATGTIVGTADYISPEQCEGRSADPRSDLYSLGMVAYECLTGERPFHRDTELATALAHLREEVPALPEEVPAPLRDLVTELLAKRPEDRPADAATVAVRAAALIGTRGAGGAPVDAPASAAAVPEGSVLTSVLRRLPLARPDRARRRLRSRSAYLVAAVLAVALAGTGFVAFREPAAAKPRVPDLQGQRFAAAARTLEARGFEVERLARDDPGRERGTVLGQEPGAGTSPVAGSVVTLTVASGRSTITPEDVVGRSYRDAARRVVAHGLVPVRGVHHQPSGIGKVVGLRPGGRLRLGSTVTLVVAEPPATITPAPSSTTSTPTGSAPSRSSGSSGNQRASHPPKKHGGHGPKKPKAPKPPKPPKAAGPGGHGSGGHGPGGRGHGGHR